MGTLIVSTIPRVIVMPSSKSVPFQPGETFRAPPRPRHVAEKHGVAYSSNITTNAYLMTPDVFADLLSWKISSYQITIDGTAEARDKKRVLKGGGPSFAVIYENLKAMRAFQDKFSVHVRINFDRENLPCLDEFMDMLKRDFAGDQRFQLRFYPVGQWGGPNHDKLAVCGTGGTDSRNWLELKAIEKGLYRMITWNQSQPPLTVVTKR